MQLQLVENCEAKSKVEAYIALFQLVLAADNVCNVVKSDTLLSYIFIGCTGSSLLPEGLF